MEQVTVTYKNCVSAALHFEILVSEYDLYFISKYHFH